MDDLVDRASPAPLSEARTDPLDEHRSFLWGLCYRMTGSASDADDLVQETFVRALERPPPDRSAPIRPWLVRVSMNLARDHLRRRKRRGYPGVWLPEPVETPAESAVPAEESPEARYGRAESASYAFLLALEALSPSQRAVLLLRDAFDFNVQETAEALEISEANVKTTLHRARRALADYDHHRQPMDESLQRRVSEMLANVIGCFRAGDFAAAKALLATDVRSLSDGGGVHFTARAPVIGAEKVARFYTKLAANASGLVRMELRLVNGLPAVAIEDPKPKRPNAPRALLRIELNAEGRIREIHSLLAPFKLTRLRRLLSS